MDKTEAEWVLKAIIKAFGFNKSFYWKENGLDTISIKAGNLNLKIGDITFSNASSSFANHRGFFTLKDAGGLNVQKELSKIEKARHKKFNY